MRRPTVGSQGGTVSYERGTPLHVKCAASEGKTNALALQHSVAYALHAFERGLKRQDAQRERLMSKALRGMPALGDSAHDFKSRTAASTSRVEIGEKTVRGFEHGVTYLGVLQQAEQRRRVWVRNTIPTCSLPCKTLQI